MWQRMLASAVSRVRRRNLIEPQDLPYQMVIGGSIDAGDMPGVMEEALARADHFGFDARRARSMALESCVVLVRRCILNNVVMAVVRRASRSSFQPDGAIVLLAGMQDNGQAHRTTLTQILSDRLGYDAGRITIRQGDSAQTPPARLVAPG